MNPTIQQLKELQQFDTQYINLRKKQKAGPEEVESLRKQIADLAATVLEHEETIQKRNAEAALLEVETAKLTEELESQEKKLTIVKNKREYEAVETTMKDLKDKIKTLESQTIALNESAEDEQHDVDELAESIAKLESKADKLEKEVAAEGETLTKALTDIKNRRKAFAAKIRDRDALEQYEQIIRSRGGLAIARMDENGTCQGCYRALTTNTQSSIMSEKLTKCSGCGRFLFTESVPVIDEE